MNVQLPEDLDELSDADLNKLAEQITAEGKNLQESIGDDMPSDEQLADAEQLAKARRAVVDKQGERNQAAEDRKTRVGAALKEIGLKGEDDDEEPAPGDETVDEEPEKIDAEKQPLGETAPALVPAAASAEAPATPVPAPAPAPTSEAASIPHDPATGRVPSEEVEDDPSHEETAVTDTQPAAPEVDAGSSLPDTVDPVAALSAHAPADAARAAGGTTTLTRDNVDALHALTEFVDNGLVSGASKGKKLTKLELASLITKKHHQLLRHASTVPFDPIPIATATVERDDSEVLTPDAHETNFGIIRRAIDRGQQVALVASGANCAPLTPNYDVFNVAEPMSPVENALPTVPAPRGGIRYVQPPLWPQAQAGVRFTTAAQEAAGYTNEPDFGGVGVPGTTAPKPCVHFVCRNVVECAVDAVSQCVTFGNLQYRTFEELVAVFLDHLAVAYAQAKEIQYLDTIEAGSTAVNYTPAYGAYRGTVFAFALAAHAYRKRNHMPLTATLDVLAPDTLVPLLAADMVNDFSLGLNFRNEDQVAVANQLFSRLNLNVSWYFDFSTAYTSTRALQQSQGAGILNGFPTLYRCYFYAPGTWVRLDGGTLDVGIVRDSTLDSQNNMQMFSEEWTQVCKAGTESIRFDLTLCPDGTAPAGVAALACAS